MNLQHVNVKIYVDGDLNVDPSRFIEVFHRWTAEQSMDELLIDVADYRHVPAGPSVMLIGHQADYSIDNTGNRYGLRYNRKAELGGSNQDRFLQAFRSAAHACQLLEAEFETEGSLRFSRHEFELMINDRALAPNTAETYTTCKPEIEAFLNDRFGHNQYDLVHDTEPRRRLKVDVKVLTPFDLSVMAADMAK